MSNSRRRVLITGGSGFIGRWTHKLFLDHGYDVFSVSIDHLKNLDSRVEQIQHNLLDTTRINSILTYVKPTDLLHLAWYVGDGYLNSSSNLEWLNASIELIRAFANGGGERAVISGTCFEHSVDSCPSMYSVCKDSLRKLIGVMSCVESISWAWGRLFHIYGPYEKPNRLVPTIINSLLTEGHVTLDSDKSNEYNYTYVEDVAKLLVCLLETDITGSIDITSPSVVRLEKLALTISRMMGYPDAAVEFGAKICPSFPFYVRDSMPYLEFPLERGLMRTINYWKGVRENHVE